jgi:nucleotide-binding universal stress UspA family protein
MTKLFTKILCPIDLNENSEMALNLAAKLAQENDARVYLMHVVALPRFGPGIPPDPFPLAPEDLRVQLAKVARKHFKASIPYEIIDKIGQPAEEIINSAEELDVDIIVMATHGRSGMTLLLLGSVAEHVVRASKRSVLTIKPGTALGPFRKILCPVDFDANSIVAMNVAWQLSRQCKAELTMLHVIAAAPNPSENPAEPLSHKREKKARTQLEKIVSEHLGVKANCELMVRSGDPAAAILEAEKDLRPDLIVIASRARTGLSDLLLGSVAERAVRESAVPVLTIRGPSA